MFATKRHAESQTERERERDKLKGRHAKKAMKAWVRAICGKGVLAHMHVNYNALVCVIFSRVFSTYCMGYM